MRLKKNSCGEHFSLPSFKTPFNSIIDHSGDIPERELHTRDPPGLGLEETGYGLHNPLAGSYSSGR